MKNITLLVVFGWLFFNTTSSVAQLAGTCSTCFDSKITKATKVDAHCTDYELKVYYTSQCDHALSHFTVAIPTCATISNLNHDATCKSEIGYDPTTGLTGFKIEAPYNFGKSSLKDLTVTFRLCANSSCSQSLCLSTPIAYKASNCFELDTATASCTTSSLKAHLEKTNISCNGLNDGQLTAVVDEGTAPYQFTWSNGAASASIQNLSAGAYSVVIKDDTGAQVTLSDSISQSNSILITSQITNASCSGLSNGSIYVTASGGSGGYSFLWGNGNTTDSLVDVSSGNYSVKVTDSFDCSTSASFFIDVEKKLMVSASNQLPACGQSNGSLSTSVTGGTSPYHYVWSNGDTTSTISNIPQGTYSLTVTDAEGCSKTVTYFLHENNTLNTTYSVTPTTCLDDSSGAIDLNVTGGTSPYTYVWSTGSTSQDITGLTAGIYSVTVKDSLGCQRTARISVFKKTFDVAPTLTQPLCAGDSTGSISLAPSGGVSPYTFIWSNGATTSSIQNLSPGTYKVTVTDSTGCSKLLTYFITSPAPISASSSVQNVSCSSFSVDLTVTGGTMPYQYLWSTGAQTEDVSGLNSGNYSVAITDANGCSLTKQIQIDSTATWSCLINPLPSTVTCSSSGNKIFTTVTGATSYSWAITSTDGSWAIESGSLMDTLQFKAGNTNTSATISLTIVKDGCTQTCTYTVSTCSSDSGTGTGTGGGNNESCGDCFSSTITKNSDGGSCATYVVNITTDGNCRYDLSHVVVAIPCGVITDYSDSAHWPLVLGKDPTTGLTGIKVDNVSNFGKAVGSFTLQFTVCFSDECASAIQNWNPVVAYKAGQCIAYDTLKIGSGSTTTSVYPNPCKDQFTIEIETQTQDNASIDMYDQMGRTVCNSQTVSLKEGKNLIPMDATALPQNIYFYRVKTSSGTFHGRVLKAGD